MNINGHELNASQRQIIREAIATSLLQWRNTVGFAATDIGAAYSRQKVRDCEILRDITEGSTCGATETNQ